MTKAKEKAIEAFPIVDQQHLRNAFVSGYEQAEKDIKERMMKDVVETTMVEGSQLELHPYNGDEGIGYAIRLNGYRIIIIPE